MDNDGYKEGGLNIALMFLTLLPISEITACPEGKNSLQALNKPQESLKFKGEVLKWVYDDL